MKKNDWKDRLNVVYSTNPDFGYEMDDDEEEEEEDGRMIVDEGDNGSRKKTQDHKKKMKSLYASAEEFEAMLEETAQARKEREETFKKRSHKRGRGNGGKKGFNGKRRK